MNSGNTHGGIQLVEARIRNFRSLREVDIFFDDLTVLIGENNSGKTSMLEALFGAIGAGRRVIEADDLFLDKKESKAPKDRAIIIDLLLKPAGEHGILDQFPEGSYWLELWGNGTSQDDKDNDFLAIRTRMAWNDGKGEFVTNRQFLNEWPDSGDLESAKVKPGSVTSAQVEPIALYIDGRQTGYSRRTP